MRRIFKIFIIMVAFVSSIFFMTSCFENGKVSGNTYVITEVKVESKTLDSDTLETMKYIAEQDKGLTLTFETDGSLSGTTKSLGGVACSSWKQEGNKVLINGGVTTLTVDGGKLTHQWGSLNGYRITTIFEKQ